MRWRVARKVFKVWSYRHRKSTVLRAVLKVTHPGPHRRTLWPLVQTAERLRTKGTDRPLTSPPPRRPRARAPDHGRYYRQAAFSRARVGQRHNAYKSARLDVTPPRLGRFRAGLGDCGRLRHLLPDVSEVCIRAARASPAPPRSLSLTAPGRQSHVPPSTLHESDAAQGRDLALDPNLGPTERIFDNRLRFSPGGGIPGALPPVAERSKGWATQRRPEQSVASRIA